MIENKRERKAIRIMMISRRRRKREDGEGIGGMNETRYEKIFFWAI